MTTLYTNSGNYRIVVGDISGLRGRSYNRRLTDYTGCHVTGRFEVVATGTAPSVPGSHPWSFAVTYWLNDVVVFRASGSGTIRFVHPPVQTSVTANAGADKSVDSGEAVTLDGSASVVAGVGGTTYAWRKISGSGGSLDDATSATPTFTAPTIAAGGSDRTIVYELTATNNGVTSAGDRVSITVRAPVTTVTADAGADKSVDSGGQVTLDGSATVENGSGDTTYAWRKISGSGGSLDDTTSATPEFTAPTIAPGGQNLTFVYELKATNNGVTSAGDRVTITVRAPVTTVTADAGVDKTVDSGGTVDLDGSATVRNGSGATRYAWRKISGAGGSLNDATSATPTFTAPTIAPGGQNLTFVYELTATNNGVTSGDRVTIIVGAPDATIVLAEAGPNRSVDAGGQVILAGSAMITRAHGATTYAWTRISGSGGTLSSSSVAQPRFIAPELDPGGDDRKIVFELAVTNNGVIARDRVTISVGAPPGGVWDGQQAAEAVEVGGVRVVAIYDGNRKIWG